MHDELINDWPTFSKKPEPKKACSVWLSVENIERIDKLKLLGHSRSAIINMVLTSYFKKEKKNHD